MPVIDTGDGQMDVISRLLKDRILLLGQQVDDEVANVLVAQLLYLANEDPKKDITLYINSPGGSVSAGMVRWLALMQFLEEAGEKWRALYGAFVSSHITHMPLSIIRPSMIRCSMFRAMFQLFALEWRQVWGHFSWELVLPESARLCRTHAS